jgi:hypothetical protein
MEVKIATPAEIAEVSKLSVKHGNIPFLPGQSVVAVLEHDQKVIGFAAVQAAIHAAGSWIDEEHRRQGHTYPLRQALDNELRRLGYTVYFSLPGNDFERQLFAKYGQVTEHKAQIRHL